MDLALLLAGELKPSGHVHRARPRVLGVSTCSLAPFSTDPEIDEKYWASFADALAVFTQETSVKVVFFSLFFGTFVVKDEASTGIHRQPPAP